MMKIYEVLSDRRAERGISYAELARRVGMNEDVVSRVFRGISNVNGKKFVALCSELNLEVNDFVDCEEISSDRATY